MTDLEILEQLKGLSPAERLKIVEFTVHQLREDMDHLNRPVSDGMGAALARAAEALRADYLSDPELTAFAALDGEAFHA